MTTTEQATRTATYGTYTFDPANRETFPIYQYRARDKYGRTVLRFEQGCIVIASMTTLPKSYADKYGTRYTVSDWDRATGTASTSDHAKRGPALAQALAVVAAKRPGVPIVDATR